MTDPNQRQDDILRFHQPLLTEDKSAGVKTRETVRIQLPVRDVREVAPTQFFRPTNPPSTESVTPDVALLEPKKETARVSSLTVASQTLAQEKKAFVPAPGIIPHHEFAPLPATEKNSKLLWWWIVLGLSALILLMQIWTYVS
ncbi:MAG TPA: hypothetical protein VH254_07475 [Candidatus Udaeobacter sp.]|jgi:hypothetical protein|nr:hypothetical protein [Candidatus Udaeobacter sp.]